MTGTVQKYDDARGFGFIQPHGENRERRGLVFFHISEFPRIDGARPVISIGDQVRFELGYSDKGNGTQATDCDLLSPAATAKRRLEAEEMDD